MERQKMDNTEPIISREVKYVVYSYVEGQLMNVFVEDRTTATTPIYAVFEEDVL
ncbi:MAG: hypothetical protein ACRBFS_05330 [Aureispira sp.]